MALYAVIHQGEISSYRDIEDWQTYPEHKKDALDEQGDGYPVLRPVEYAGAGSIETPSIEPTRVLITRSHPPITADDVVAERLRRLQLGFDYDFGDVRGVHHIGTTAADMVGWDEVTSFAQALTALGDTTTSIAIVTDTGPCAVTSTEWAQILVAAAQFRQPLWASSFVLQAMQPIPADYDDNSYWQA